MRLRWTERCSVSCRRVDVRPAVFQWPHAQRRATPRDRIAATFGNDRVAIAALIRTASVRSVSRLQQAVGNRGMSRLLGAKASDTPKLAFEPAVNKPPCACVVFVHNEERKARKTARLMHTNCRYNLAMVEDPAALGARNIRVPKHGEKDPNSLFPAEIMNACLDNEQACRDYLGDKKDSTKPDEILGFAQRQYFLAIRDCSDGFKLPVVALHNNALGDTATYRRKMAAKGVDDLALDVEKSSTATGADVLSTMRKKIKEKFGARGVEQTLNTEKTTNIFRWCQSDDIERCHVGDPQHPDNVTWVTNLHDFELLAKTPVNVVLESLKPKPPKSESAGDLSTMYVLMLLRNLEAWTQNAEVVKEGVLDEITNKIGELLLTPERPIDSDKIEQALAAMVQLANQAKGLRFANIETAGKDWDTEADRVANFRAIVSVLTGLGLHCCDVSGKGDAAVEAGLKGDDV